MIVVKNSSQLKVESFQLFLYCKYKLVMIIFTWMVIIDEKEKEIDFYRYCYFDNINNFAYTKYSK